MEKPFCPWRLGAVCCMGACIRQEKIFFSGGRDVGADGRKPFHCKGYMVLRRKEGRLKKVLTVSDRAGHGCETGGFMLT